MRRADAAFDFRPVLDKFGAPDGAQELICDSFLRTAIPEALKYGTFAGELRLYTSTPSNQPEDRMVLCSFKPMEITYSEEQRKLLFRALGGLSEQERRLYQLCFVFEQDARKVATVFKINVKNVYRRKETLVLKLTRLVQTVQSH